MAYLILAAGNLVACLVVVGWLNAVFPDNPEPVLWFLGIFLILGPLLFILPDYGRVRRTSPDRRPVFRIPIYLAALALLALTAAFSLEFNRQLVTLQIPLVILDPIGMSFLFYAAYLPSVFLLCYGLTRLARAPKSHTTLLLNPGYGIPIPPVPQIAAGSIPLSAVEPASKKEIKNQLTLTRPRVITNPISVEGQGDVGPMETIELSKLKQIQDQFSALTNLSLLTYDARGDLVCEPSQENPVCRIVQKTPKGQQHCKSYCGRNIGIALQGNETVFFKCEMNLHVFSIPIVLDSRTKLVVQGGKSYLDPQEFIDSHAKAAAMDIVREDLSPLADRLRIHDQGFLTDSARFLNSVLPYLFATIHEKNTMSTRFSRLMTLFTLTADLKLDDLSQLIHTLLNTLGILFNLNAASVLLWDRSSQVFKTVATFGQSTESLRSYQTDAATGLVRTVLEQHHPVSTDETLEILRAGFPSGTTSVHLFPLFTRNHRTTSLLCVFDTALGDEDRRVITTFCQQISAIHENAQLQRERHDLAKDVSVLLEIAKTVGSALDSDELFSIILEKSTQFLQAEQGSIMLLDEERRELTVKAMKGLNKKIVELLKIRPGEGISGKVLSSGSPLVVADIEEDDRVVQEKRPRYKTKSFISIPLKIDGRTIGVLNIADKISGEIFSEEDLHLLVSIGAYASVAIERSRFYQKTEELKKISITDSLTGLLNRRYFQERISEETERSRRHHLPLSLIMLDVDDFKSVNDTLGHPVGDEVLKIMARCLRNCIRTIDVAARYGGEEFTVILPQTSKADAQTIADRICAEVYRMDLPFAKADQKLILSVSLGLATYPEDAENLEDLIRNADIALYAAKSQGKNRVVVYGK